MHSRSETPVSKGMKQHILAGLFGGLGSSQFLSFRAWDQLSPTAMIIYTLTLYYLGSGATFDLLPATPSSRPDA